MVLVRRDERNTQGCRRPGSKNRSGEKEVNKEEEDEETLLIL